jgi:hypothetical protein
MYPAKEIPCCNEWYQNDNRSLQKKVPGSRQFNFKTAGGACHYSGTGIQVGHTRQYDHFMCNTVSQITPAFFLSLRICKQRGKKDR